MKLISGFLSALFNILRSQLGALNLAEVRSYPWDGVSPLRLSSGWTDMYGSPYSKSFDPGKSEGAANVGGWVDLRGMAVVAVTARVTGSAADCFGEVVVTFQGAYSVTDPQLQFTKHDLAVPVTVNGTTEQRETVALDVSALAFLRIYGCDNRANKAATVRVTLPDSAKPVVL